MITTIEYILSTSVKRHLVGGILLSISLLFAGLSVTVMTIKEPETEEEEDIE